MLSQGKSERFKTTFRHFLCVFQVNVFTEMSRMDEEETLMLQHDLQHLLQMVLCAHVVACLKP